MSDPLLTVSAAGLRAAGVTLSSAEAVACVLLTGEALQWSADAPDPSRVILRGDGRINVTTAGAAENGSASVESYARLLHRLLPEAGDGGQTPGALRLTVARGLGAIDAPPFASLDDFRAGIARFLTHAPEEHIVIAVVRWAELMGSRSDEPVLERRVAGPRVDTLRRFLREADLERYALVASAPVAEAPRTGADTRLTALDLADRGAPVTFSTLDPVPERSVRWRAFAAVAALAAVVGWAAANVVRDGPPALSPDALLQSLRMEPVAPAPAPTVPGSSGTSAADTEAASLGRGEDAAPLAAGEDTAPLAGRGNAAAPVEAPPSAMEPTTGTAGDRLGRGDRATAAGQETIVSASGENGLPSSAVPTGGDPAVSPYWPSGTEDRTVIDAGLVTYSGFRLANVIDGDHHTGHVKLSPDGSRVAFDSDRDGGRAVYVASRDGTGVQRVSGTGLSQAPAWAPDSRRVAFLRAEEDDPQVHNLWLVNLDTGEERRLTAWRYGETSPADWFADGRRISYAHDGRLYVMDLSSGASRSYDSPVPGRGIGAIGVSPEGQRIAFNVLNDGVWMLNLASGSTRRVLDDPTIQQLAWSPTGTSLAYQSRRAGHWAVLVLTRP